MTISLVQKYKGAEIEILELTFSVNINYCLQSWENWVTLSSP